MTFAKPFLTVLVFVATFYFVYWVPFSLLPFEPNEVVALVGSLLCATAASVVFWRSGRSRTGHDGAPGPGRSVVTGALAVGAIGFVAGFFGPMLFTPSSNQGPLLGLFITGPAGVLLGALGGYVYWRTSKPR